MPGEPRAIECPYCGEVIMPDNAVRCDCGEVMCFACCDLHECLYTRDPEYRLGIMDEQDE